jgi:hypothetical protein
MSFPTFSEARVSQRRVASTINYQRLKRVSPITANKDLGEKKNFQA